MKTPFFLTALLAAFTLAAVPSSAASYTFTATGTSVPTTAGVDPWGNPYLIRDFGGTLTWGVPGLFAGGPTQWICPDCLLEVQVSAAAVFNGAAGGPIPIAPDTVSGLQGWRNVTDASNYNVSFAGNTVVFTANPGNEIHIGDFVNGVAYFQTPFAPGTSYQITVTYITDDACIPEPASLALMGSGLLLAGLVKRRALWQ